MRGLGVGNWREPEVHWHKRVFQTPKLIVLVCHQVKFFYWRHWIAAGALLHTLLMDNSAFDYIHPYMP